MKFYLITSTSKTPLDSWKEYGLFMAVNDQEAFDIAVPLHIGLGTDEIQDFIENGNTTDPSREEEPLQTLDSIQELKESEFMALDRVMGSGYMGIRINQENDDRVPRLVTDGIW